jgi:glycosyltransferase involved in cell wall biosynthesis
LEVRFATGSGAAASIVICAYNGRDVIDGALRSLRSQDFKERFEVVAVISGDDDCCKYVRSAYPDVRVIASDARLHPGAARNAGVTAATAEVIAFLPADGVAASSWLRARVIAHRSGFPLVGGSITNGTPWSIVGTSSYYVEYAASVPVARVLRKQPLPHTLSYTRDVFRAVGQFPETNVPGEDTLFNAACMQRGFRVAYVPEAAIGHRNLTSLREVLRHARSHGQGLARCIADYGLSPPRPLEGRRKSSRFAVFVYYPAWRWIQTALLLSRTPLRLLTFAALAPLVIAQYLAGSVGFWDQLVGGRQ